MICLCLAEKAKSMMSNIFNAAELESFDVPGLGILAPHVAGMLRV